MTKYGKSQTNNTYVKQRTTFVNAAYHYRYGQRILTKGRIIVLSPLAAANGFVRLWPPNGISIVSAIFAGLTNMINKVNRPTDRPRYSVCSNRLLSLAIIAAMQPNITHICLHAYAYAVRQRGRIQISITFIKSVYNLSGSQAFLPNVSFTPYIRNNPRCHPFTHCRMRGATFKKESNIYAAKHNLV